MRVKTKRPANRDKVAGMRREAECQWLRRGPFQFHGRHESRRAVHARQALASYHHLPGKLDMAGNAARPRNAGMSDGGTRMLLKTSEERV